MEARQQPRKVYLKTFGCQMNIYDSSKMLEQLQAHNYVSTDDPALADLILINTCAIREKSEHKVYSLLGSLSRIKSHNPSLKIGVGGCVAQQRGGEILDKAKQVDFVFGTDNIFELPELLGLVERGERPIRTEWHSRKDKIQNFIPQFPQPSPGQGPVPEAPVKSSIAITKGCNNFCTFCVVPYTRGREVSREPGNIVAEARQLARRGAKELTLLGQNVNSYKAGKVTFVDLLHHLHEVEGLERLRYISPHPKDFGEPLARAHRDLPKLCEYLHLPFQAGSDRILKAMRRNHKISNYLDKIEMVKRTVPGISLSTDIIVGFPSETEADFQETLDVMRQVRFDHIYAFKFSPRSDTPAARHDGQLPEAVKAERLAQVLELHEAQLREINGAMVGSRQEILLEGPHPRDAGAMTGRTRGNKSTTVIDCAQPPGTCIDVEIVATRKFSLVGKEVSHGI